MKRSTDTETLWQEFHVRLLSYIRRRVRSEEDADDVLQDVFFRIHEADQPLEGIRNISAWVHRIASNAIADHFRRRASGPGPFAQLSHEPEETLDPQDDPTKELGKCLEPMLDALPEEYANAIRDTDLRGGSQKEAASRAGVSVSGMKSRVQRGRKKLRELLQECCTIELDARKGVIDYRPRGGKGRCEGCDS